MPPELAGFAPQPIHREEDRARPDRPHLRGLDTAPNRTSDAR